MAVLDCVMSVVSTNSFHPRSDYLIPINYQHWPAPCSQQLLLLISCHFCKETLLLQLHLGKLSDLIISESTPRTEPGHLGNLQFWIEESASELQQASELQKELYVILYEYGGKDLLCRAISACRKIF